MKSLSPSLSRSTRAAAFTRSTLPKLACSGCSQTYLHHYCGTVETYPNHRRTHLVAISINIANSNCAPPRRSASRRSNKGTVSKPALQLHQRTQVAVVSTSCSGISKLKSSKRHPLLQQSTSPIHDRDASSRETLHGNHKYIANNDTRINQVYIVNLHIEELSLREVI